MTQSSPRDFHIHLVSDATGRHVVRLGRDFPFHHVDRKREIMTACAAHAARLQAVAEGLAALDAAEIGDRPMVLMALATIRAESAGFRPIDEGISRYNTSPSGHPFDLYDHRHDLGNMMIETPEQAVAMFRKELVRELRGETPRADQSLDMVLELRGKHLACWCPLSAPCHADLLLDLANAGEGNIDG